MRKGVVDFFPFFSLTGKELLNLRINLLKDHVDKFIICESNKTHSGLPVERELRKFIEELHLPADMIDIIDLDIPDDDNLEIKQIDYFNCYEQNSSNNTSLKARVRERMQKDSLNTVFEKYDEDTVFIVSDSDEIIDPQYINWITTVARQKQNIVLKVPLVHLEGRADLRVYHENGSIKLWNKGMFVCTKSHLRRNTVSEIRGNFSNIFPIQYLSIDDKVVEDIGWHFSWMGNKEKRYIKAKSFVHYQDTLSNLIGGTPLSAENISVYNQEPAQGRISVAGEVNTILKHYPHEKLPKIIFLLPDVKEFLLPSTSIPELEQEYIKACNTPTDINEHLYILHELANSCRHVTEMGVRTGMSTRALLASDCVLVSYDLELDTEVMNLFTIAKNKYGKNVNYIKADTRVIDIEETDLLFIDTLHTYEQLKCELYKHSSKVKKFIAFHDTHTFGVKGEFNQIGLLPAIIEFMIDHPEWKFKIHKINNNGFTVLERR